jgi:hypothetical protein
MTLKDHSKWYNHVISFVLIFFILYDINFKFLPYFTTGRIAFLFLLITGFNKTYFDNIFYWGSTIFGLLLLYAIFQSIYSTDLTQVSRLFWFITYGWILPYVVSFNLGRAGNLYSFLFFAVTLQAIFVLLMFFNIEFRFLILDIVEIDTNINPYENFQRSFGFTSLTGSAFSIVQAGGFLSGIYYFIINKFNSILIKLLIWLGLIAILLSAVLIGRMGLFISLFFLLYCIIFISNTTQKIIFLLLSFYFFKIDFESSFIHLTENVEGFKSEWFITWIEEAFNFRKNSTLEELNTMYVPPITVETIFGTGRVKSESGFGNASMNDSGYIQTYYSLGLIMSAVFYLTYFCLSFFRWLNSKRNPLILIFLIIVFLIEYKEPFIFKYSLPFLLTTFLVYENKFQKS